MALPHPGSAPVRQPIGLSTPLGRHGIVLDVNAPSLGKRIYDGNLANVLLLPDYTVLYDVWVTEIGGGSRQSGSFPLQPTDATISRQVYDATRGLAFMPDPSPAGGPPGWCDKWGSHVIVNFLYAGAGAYQPYISHGLSHPSSRSTSRQVASGQSTSLNEKMANGARPSTSTSDIDEATRIYNHSTRLFTNYGAKVPDDYKPPKSTPASELIYMTEYASAWESAAQRAAVDGTQRYVEYRPLNDSPESKATAAAKTKGDEDGQVYGLDLYKKKHPDGTTASSDPAESPSAETPTDPEPGDEEGGGKVAATTSGADWNIQSGGTKLLVKEDGFIVDSRGSGPIRFQASDDGLKLTTASGVQVVINKDTVNLGEDSLLPQNGVVTGMGIDPFTGMKYVALGNASLKVRSA